MTTWHVFRWMSTVGFFVLAVSEVIEGSIGMTIMFGVLSLSCFAARQRCKCEQCLRHDAEIGS